MSAPATRPVHPCIRSLTDGSRGAEYSTWAYITTDKRRCNAVPNLVTAAASTVCVYSLCEKTGKLRLEHRFGHLNGSVIYLGTLSSPVVRKSHVGTNGEIELDCEPDALLIGFAGHPRLAVVRVTDSILEALSLLDLTPALRDHSYGSVSVFEQDAVISCLNASPGSATVACILGGGVAVAAIQVIFHKSCRGWMAEEPYILPLSNLSRQLPHNAFHGMSGFANLNSGVTMSTGFGDIYDCTFLPYLEPVLVLLHSAPGGKIWSGRLGAYRGDGARARAAGEEDGPRGGAPPLFLTAVSVSVTHHRTALLWSREVPADSHFVSASSTCLTSIGPRRAALNNEAASLGTLVVGGANTLVLVDPTGRTQQVIAVNGWARSTCPASLHAELKANPVLKLSIQLDGSCLTWLSDTTALLCLRAGQLYMLQQTADIWTFLPTGKTLGPIGEIATLSCVPFNERQLGLLSKLLESKESRIKMGMVFAGSRLGDSLLFGYAMELVRDNSFVQSRIVVKAEQESNLDGFINTTASFISDDYEQILQMEENALYAAPSESHASVSKLSAASVSDEDETEDPHQRHEKRQRVAQITVVRALTPMDVLVNLGPLGPSSEGPISKVPDFLSSTDTNAPLTSTDPDFGATAYTFPSGFGSSGAIALVTVPGRDDRMILAEEDCLNADCVFSLPQNKLVLLGLSTVSSGGVRVLKLGGVAGNELSELNLEDWCSVVTSDQMLFSNALEVFQSMLLGAGEFSNGHVALLVGLHQSPMVYRLVILNLDDAKAEILQQHELESDHGSELTGVTPFLSTLDSSGEPSISFGCLWSSGSATFMVVNERTGLAAYEVASSSDSLMDIGGDVGDDDEANIFYSNQDVVAVDVFLGPSKYFNSRSKDDGLKSVGTLSAGRSTDIDQQPMPIELDDDDEELYSNARSSGTEASFGVDSLEETMPDEEVVFAAVCRQSGQLEITVIGDTGGVLVPCWQAHGAGCGNSILAEHQECRFPKSHLIAVREMRFFYCGSSPSKLDEKYCMGSLCLAISTSIGDFNLYSYNQHRDGRGFFRRRSLKGVARNSHEFARHQTKLIRKGMIRKDSLGSGGVSFRYNHIHRFSGVSGQDGAFVAGLRPQWIVSERGYPMPLYHRSRHAAPAGGKDKAVSGFCSGFTSPDGRRSGFLTLHERVGRVGTQRLTLFKGLSSLFHAQGTIAGGGFCIEKISLGVTVRRIAFIDDDEASTSDHPLFAVLVSREIELDQGLLNSDGLTPEERNQQEEEKEVAKIRRQVEADLGGFDVESEWVEEIQREDCFKIDTDLGGAPPIRKSAYSLWIVDAANKWVVVDSYELGEHEHGLTLQTMSLSDFPEGAGASSLEGLTDDDLPKKFFLVLGTGVVDHNGEDVSSKGRVLLFEVRGPKSASRLATSQVADLSLYYEKDILHGPVTTLSCLSVEGKNRLVIGAGSDVNLEQWGSNRLTQVGFFRATMQILDILLFKNFFLLSDAYDSIYFLVWRESDKSLTLLAKDYDPIPVYAAGLLSRGAAMTFICHDDRQNLQFFQYAPGEAAARGGNKLVCRADCHWGTQTTDFSSHACRSSLFVQSATPTSTLAALKQQDAFFGRSDDDQRLGAHFGTTDGTIESIVPLSEPVYWRLTALQSVIANALETDCALSHRAWRLYRRTTRRQGCRYNDRKKGVVDGDLVLTFADRPTAEQEDLASAIGSTVDLVMDNLLELECSSLIL